MVFDAAVGDPEEGGDLLGAEVHTQVGAEAKVAVGEVGVF